MTGGSRWHHGASQGPGMCRWQEASEVAAEQDVNGTCELDMNVVDNTIEVRRIFAPSTPLLYKSIAGSGADTTTQCSC